MDFAEDYIRRHNSFLAPSTIDPSLKIVLEHGSGKGIRIKDTSGKTYMNFDSEVAVNALGYRHPKLMEFRQKYPEFFDFSEATGRYYAMRNVKLSWRDYPELSPAYLAEKLIKKTFPGKPAGDYMVIMKETGALAVNSAVKACLKSGPQRRHFIAFDGAFHGRVEFSRALTQSKPSQQEDYPETGIHVWHLPYPKTREDIKVIYNVFNRVPWNNVNAAIVEIIQGEGGMQSADSYLLKNLLIKLQEEYGILAGVDDIQAGSGRTGFWSSWEWLNSVTPNTPEFTPDFVMLGKALAAGLPISAVIFPNENAPLGWEGGTFPWFPASVAQAILFMDILEEENLIEKVKENGRHLEVKLNNIEHECDLDAQFCDYRTYEDYGTRQKGTGFMQGLEFEKDQGKISASELRNKTLANLAENGILTQGAGLDGLNPTIRFTPPYITAKEDIDEMIEILKKSIIRAITRK